MEKLIQEYAVILACSGLASDKYHNLLALIEEGVITLDDLDEFSDGLKGRFTFLMRDTE